MNLLYVLPIFVPVGLISNYAGGPELLTFAAAALGETAQRDSAQPSCCCGLSPDQPPPVPCWLGESVL